MKRVCSAAFAMLGTSALGAEGGGFVEDTRWHVLQRSVYEHRSYLHGDRSNGGRNASLPRAQGSDHGHERGCRGYSVQPGPFASPEAARDTAEQLRASLQVSPMVLERR